MTPRARDHSPVPDSVPAATRGRTAAHPRPLSGRGATASAGVARAAADGLGPAPGGTVAAEIAASGAVAGGV